MLKLEIVTPERRVLDAEVDYVSLPTASGEAGILPNHAPLISALKPGIMSFTVKNVIDKLAISSGFAEVNSDRVSVLVDVAETADDVDVEAAREQRETAEKAMVAAGLVEAESAAELRDSFEHAAARVELGGGR
jgi:F-type H+-transporting ATPase subunit epsilon